MKKNKESLEMISKRKQPALTTEQKLRKLIRLEVKKLLREERTWEAGPSVGGDEYTLHASDMISTSNHWKKFKPGDVIRVKWTLSNDTDEGAVLGFNAVGTHGFEDPEDEGTQMFFELSPGIYHVVDGTQGTAIVRKLR